MSASPVWPLAGLSLAALLVLGLRLWPGVLLGSFLAALSAVGLAAGKVPQALGVAALGAVGSTLTIVTGAWLAERFAGGRQAFSQPQHVFRFVGLSAMLSTLLSPTLGLAGLCLMGFESWRHFGLLWLSWWLGDMSSVILLTPLLVVWSNGRWPRVHAARLAEGVALLVILTVVCWLVFGGWLIPQAEAAHLSFLLILPLLWTALRFGPRGTATLAFGLGCVATVATLQAHGPFTLSSRYTSLLLLQNFIAVTTVLSLMLSADVVQRQHTDAWLQASAQRYRELFEVNPQPMWVYDYDTLSILAVNNAAIERYGYSRGEFLCLRLPDLWLPEDVPMLLEAVARARTGESALRERRHRKKDGTYIDVEVSWHNLLFDRRPAAILLVTDITERKRAEAAVRESEDRLRLALEAGRMGTWTYELRPHPRLIGSPETDRMFSLRPGELDGSLQGLLRLIHPDDHAQLQNVLAQAMARNGTYELEFRVLPRGRPMGWVLVRGRAYHNAQGKPERLVGIAVDVTELKAAQEEVFRLNAELEARVVQRTAQMEALNQELEAFCYSVSHDLRAPLRSVRGFSEVLLARYAGQLDERGKQFLQRSCEASQHMDTLIEDLLGLSRVGRAELRQQSVDLSALARSILCELQHAEPQRQVEAAVAPGLRAQGDERLLRIVLDNLLRNAWKFTGKRPDARIEVGLTPDPKPVFFVRDNGAGFDPAYCHKLFGVFQRLHSASEFPGTGVGLAIVKRIIRRHGGRIWATSAVGAGATFYFTLPGDGSA